MNRKKEKKGKLKLQSGKRSVKDVSEDVLVLPPNILEKLGINLENVQFNQVSSASDISNSKFKNVVKQQISKEHNETVFRNNNSKDDTNHSSIIETADLMKKSVFLSPTFNTSQSFVSPNNLNYVNLKQTEFILSESYDNMILSAQDDVEIINTTQEKINSDMDCHNNEKFSENKYPTSIERENIKNKNHIDTQNKVYASRNKIKIISEEIIDTTIFKNLKSDKSCKQSFVPVPIDTIISNNDCDNEINVNICLTSSGSNENVLSKTNKLQSRRNSMNCDLISAEPSCSMTLVCDRSSENNVIFNNTPSVKYANQTDLCSKIQTHLDNSVTGGSENCKQPAERNINIMSLAPQDINNVGEKLSPNISSLDLDTSYLECIEPVAINSNSRNKMENDDILEQSSEKFINSKQNEFASKLCVQGVEKPGGQMTYKNKTSIKTFDGNKKPTYPLILSNQVLVGDLVEEKTNIDNTTQIEPSNIQLLQHFCQCVDFGNMDHSLLDGDYTHIHFIESKSTCPPDIVYGIYDDNFDLYNIIDNCELNAYEETMDSVNSLCFNAAHHTDEVMKVIQKKNKVVAEAEDLIVTDLNDTKNRENKTIYIDLQNLENSNCEELQIMLDHDTATKKRTHPGNIKEKCNDVAGCKIQKITDTKTNLPTKPARDTTKKDVPLSPLNEDKSPTHMSLLDKEETSKNDIVVRCGVCREDIADSNWLNHIENNHNYLAWKEGDAEINLNDRTQVQKHLRKILKKCQKLVCSKCGSRSKNVKTYLQHLKSCDVFGDLTTSSMINRSVIAEEDLWDVPLLEIKSKVEVNMMEVKCAVCNKGMARDQWLDHLAGVHSYLAWEAGRPPLNFSDMCAIYEHLDKICKRLGELTCQNCFYNDTDVNLYLKHVKTCGHTDWSRKILVDVNMDETTTEESIKCGVCQIMLDADSWMAHSALEHGYLAWIDSKPKLDLDDEEAIYDHLYCVSKDIGGLLCVRCGRRRKYVKSYMQHMKKCDGTLQLSVDNFKDMLNQTMVSYLNTTSESQASPPPADTSLTGGRAVVCAVCSATVSRNQWEEHSRRAHRYMAWKDGDPPLDCTNEMEVYEHLQKIVKKVGWLMCDRCTFRRKSVKMYLRHIEQCSKSASREQSIVRSDDTPERVETTEVTNDTTEVTNDTMEITNDTTEVTNDTTEVTNNTTEVTNDTTEVTNDTTEVTNDTMEVTNETVSRCGVCHQEVAADLWIEHIANEHKYLAWKEGEPELDLKDDKVVHAYLNMLSKDLGGLRCAACGCRRKYVKMFLEHVASCTGTGTSTADDTLNESVTSELNSTLEAPAKLPWSRALGASVVCGVCRARMPAAQWVEHARCAHRYRAWRQGDPPLNVDDEEAVHAHLSMLNKHFNGLKCDKCDVTRKYLKSYLAHVDACDVTSISVAADGNTSGLYKCAVCSESVEPHKWKSHAMDKHYNVAWVVGKNPIDVKNIFAVEKYLKAYKVLKNKLQCRACGLTRVSLAGFYAHIIQCGKSEQEIDMYKEVCDICNNKYLSIYKYQHQTMHREQENAKIRKLLEAEKKGRSEDVIESTGPRRAAEKAKNVIQIYNNSQNMHKCLSCGYDADDETELRGHACRPPSVGSDKGSVKFDSTSSEEDSFDSDVESDHSRNEMKAELTKKKHCNSLAAQVPRIPFAVQNLNAYLEESAHDFCNVNLTSESLFPKWHTCTYEMVVDGELERYLPLVKTSCQTMVCGDKWLTLDQFEARAAHGIISIFVGGAIHCMSWVPPSKVGSNASASNFLAVANHRDSDSPRLDAELTYQYPNMIQIWEFADFNDSLPEFVLGLAHEHGAVWGMDWCPSGARDPPGDGARLGLLAVACSDGLAYIYSVPYPATITKTNELLCKLKPVAELRFSRSERKKYQATSITWSLEKGHSTIVVGYSDGIVAYFDVQMRSPMLTAVDGGRTVLYPYDEERRHKSCIADVSTYPCAVGVSLCTAAPSGASLTVGGETLRSQVPSARATFLPHWPAANLIAGELGIVTHAVNELECWGVGRRFGAVQWWCGCRWCGATAVMAPPALRCMLTHPADMNALKQDIAIIQMRPLDSKIRKIKNDALSVKLEPSKYENAVRTYGLEVRRLTGKTKRINQEINKNKELTPERFPLADVTSMAFCPSALHHRKLAIATHSGVIFLMTV